MSMNLNQCYYSSMGWPAGQVDKIRWNCRPRRLSLRSGIQ